MLNKFDRPATLRTPKTARIKMDNPLGPTQDLGSMEANAAAELELVRQTMLACDRGKYRGPFEINTIHFFTICFESFEQREAFRKAMRLINHEELYWAGSAVDGTLGLLKSGSGGNAFSRRPNPFARDTQAPPKKKGNAENAERYSDLRAEVKKTMAKMAGYTDDRTWIAVCFPDENALAAFRKKWGLPDGKYIHVDDWVAALAAKSIFLDVPKIAFALRATARPDKALSALVG